MEKQANKQSRKHSFIRTEGNFLLFTQTDHYYLTSNSFWGLDGKPEFVVRKSGPGSTFDSRTGTLIET